MASHFYVLSLREERPTHAYACVIEFEDVIVSSLNGLLVTTNNIQLIANAVKPQHSLQTPKYLFVVGIAFVDVVQLLKNAKNYLDDFDGVYAYVFDSIIFESDLNKPKWKKSLSRYYKLAKKITRLFVPVQFSVIQFEQCFGISVSYLPLASDVLQFGDASQHKFIEVNGYGRQDLACSSLLANAFNQRGTNQFYYHTDHTINATIADNYAHRRFFWQLLRASKIALAFDAMSANNDNRFRFSFVGQRWFESTAAGCVVVGRRPTCPEMDVLFPLKDSTIEIPRETKLILPFIEALLTDSTRLKEIGHNNYYHALKKNDWRHRLLEMLNMLDIPPSQQLLNEISMLDSKASTARLIKNS